MRSLKKNKLFIFPSLENNKTRTHSIPLKNKKGINN